MALIPCQTAWLPNSWAGAKPGSLCWAKDLQTSEELSTPRSRNASGLPDAGEGREHDVFKVFSTDALSGGCWEDGDPKSHGRKTDLLKVPLEQKSVQQGQGCSGPSRMRQDRMCAGHPCPAKQADPGGEDENMLRPGETAEGALKSSCMSGMTNAKSCNCHMNKWDSWNLTHGIITKQPLLVILQNKSCACWATPGPRSQGETNPDFGQSLSLDFNNKEVTYCCTSWAQAV
ncbi:hypothetical protein MJG53_002028 [Ovis ammon polii x Ovis aries]|uniref:Uncharacterized protein n=1 Tax=Ovis ammon polii x Ovis aries TaxID=2918886 RepID=A0ACB9VN71_9CETA|nr:hypothetical protein MJG53_002028 [Ovis ammon polii x Ovis aries]